MLSKKLTLSWALTMWSVCMGCRNTTQHVQDTSLKNEPQAYAVSTNDVHLVRLLVNFAFIFERAKNRTKIELICFDVYELKGLSTAIRSLSVDSAKKISDEVEADLLIAGVNCTHQIENRTERLDPLKTYLDRVAGKAAAIKHSLTGKKST